MRAQFDVPVEGEDDIGVDHPQQGHRVGAMASSHVAVVLSGTLKHLLQQVLLLLLRHLDRYGVASHNVSSEDMTRGAKGRSWQDEEA